MVHCNCQCEKLVWIFSSAYLDENWRQGKHYRITNVNQGNYYQLHVSHTIFQPTLIKQNSVPLTCLFEMGVKQNPGRPFNIHNCMVPSALEIQCKVNKGQSRHSLPMRDNKFQWSQALTLHCKVFLMLCNCHIEMKNKHNLQSTAHIVPMLFTCVSCSYSCCNNYNPHLKTHMPFKLMYKLSLIWQRHVR